MYKFVYIHIYYFLHYQITSAAVTPNEEFFKNFFANYSKWRVDQ